MYLSHLMIDVGDNPDRPRPGRLWLRNIYHVHQRLSMAFPTREQRAEDPRFLRPFDPPGFGRPRFLFRIDNTIEQDCPRAIILLQSDRRPDWDYAFQNARMFLAAEPEIREYNPAFPPGAEFRFRIRVNLSKKGKKSKNGDDLRKPREGTDRKGRAKDQGKRVSLNWDKDSKPEDVIVPWFANKGWVKLEEQKEPRQAFELRACNVVQIGWVTAYRPNTKSKEERMKFRSALLEGTLRVTDPPAFAQAIASGIGPAKAFGFGLLSVAPLEKANP
jgi:CRISPR system Cascade subunit CasE